MLSWKTVYYYRCLENILLYWQKKFNLWVGEMAQVRWTEFCARYPQGAKRELIPASFLQISICTLWQACPSPPPRHVHKQTNTYVEVREMTGWVEVFALDLHESRVWVIVFSLQARCPHKCCGEWRLGDHWDFQTSCRAEEMQTPWLKR